MLLPNEPRILGLNEQRLLTETYLLPVLDELEACFLAVRHQVDPELQSAQPIKLGKPYPLGQCLEISTAVFKRVRSVEPADMSVRAAVGLASLREFLRAGGQFRLVWGDLRGQYFQNAFQLGTLYVDVSNDTVVPTKPKVEILPFEEAQLVPIRDFMHFRHIASSYWQDAIFPNHVVPEIAPYCPLIHVTKRGAIRLHDATLYMASLAARQSFVSSETVLREDPMPDALFECVRAALSRGPHKLASDVKQGRQLALQKCLQYRAKRWHQVPLQTKKAIASAQRINLDLARVRYKDSQKENLMPTLTIDNVAYDLESLSAEAQAHLSSIQFVDHELARLQSQVAAMQTARNVYVQALKAALPVASSATTVL